VKWSRSAHIYIYAYSHIHTTHTCTYTLLTHAHTLPHTLYMLQTFAERRVYTHTPHTHTHTRPRVHIRTHTLPTHPHTHTHTHTHTIPITGVYTIDHGVTHAQNLVSSAGSFEFFRKSVADLSGAYVDAFKLTHNYSALHIHTNSTHTPPHIPGSPSTSPSRPD
jgi:hypothetical protein